MSRPTDADFNQASGLAGTAFRNAMNDYIAAILTKNSGSGTPSTTFQFMEFIDTDPTLSTLFVRNEADDASIKLAEFNADDTITLFSGGAAVVGLGNTSAFTANQRIEVTGAAANFKAKSDLDTGIVASFDLAGENAANEEIIAAALDASITTNTDGLEDAELALKVIRGGAETTRMTLGAIVDVNGTLDADVLSQGGSTVAQLIEAAKGAMTTDSFTGAVTVNTDLTRGERNKFTGSVAANVTVDSGTAGDVFPIMNDGTAALTFVAGGGVTLVGATGLAVQKVCTLEYVTATRVYIYGENA